MLDNRRRTKFRYRPQKKNHSKRYFFTFLILLLAGGVFYFLDIKPKKITTSETKVAATEEKIKIPKIVIPPKVNITDEINKILIEYPNVSTSVTMIDLNSGTKTPIGNSNVYTAASTTKVLSAVCLLERVEAGKTTLDKVVGGYKLSWHLKQMINQSNNNSWEVINQTIGYQNLINCAKNKGLTSYNFYNNTVSGSEMATLLQQLYAGQLLTVENTNLLLSHMQNTNYEYLIPSGLPSETVFYHKYGAYGTNLHDIAIIKAKNPFVLTIYTGGQSINNEQRYALFKKITQTIYEYQNN